MLIDPRAEQTEPRIDLLLLDRTEIETEHPLAPRDQTEMSNLYPETSSSSTQSRFAWFARMPEVVVLTSGNSSVRNGNWDLIRGSAK